MGSNTAGMTAYLLFLHLLNLALPAVALAGLMVAMGGWVAAPRAARPWVASWFARLAWTAGLNLLVLTAALLWFRADGKMVSYGAMVLASALAQLVMWRSWRP